MDIVCLIPVDLCQEPTLGTLQFVFKDTPTLSSGISPGEQTCICICRVNEVNYTLVWH